MILRYNRSRADYDTIRSTSTIMTYSYDDRWKWQMKKKNRKNIFFGKSEDFRTGTPRVPVRSVFFKKNVVTEKMFWPLHLVWSICLSAKNVCLGILIFLAPYYLPRRQKSWGEKTSVWLNGYDDDGTNLALWYGYGHCSSCPVHFSLTFFIFILPRP